MKELFASDMSAVYGKAAEDTCSHCGLRVYCWEKQRETSLSDFNSLSDSLRKKEGLKKRTFLTVL